MTSISLTTDNEGKSKILLKFGKNVECLHKDVDLVTSWAKAQPHFPEIPSRNMIEFILLNSKFSIENTKRKLDMYYTIKSMFPQVYNKINPRLPRMKAGLDVQYIIPLPKLIDDMYRVTIFKLKDNQSFDGFVQIGNLINLSEVRLQEDFIVSDVAIFDLEHLSVNHVLKSTPMHVKIAATIIEKVYGNRIKEVHIINHPPVFQKLLILAKMFIKPKLHNRLRLHASIDALLDYVPLEVLPKDYGGCEKSLDDLEEMWKRKLMEYADRFDKLDTLRVNESLRPTPMKNIEKFGVQGTFRKLNID